MSEQPVPQLIIIAGPNGAGKSSSAAQYFADIIEQGLYLDPDKVARDNNLSTVAAGREVLRRQSQYLAQKRDFARETTASGREPITLADQAKALGYQLTLIFVFIDKPELLQMRVAGRV
ncbi:MAG: zeta toxin family protein, partial [Pseudomonadota bacterium]